MAGVKGSHSCVSVFPPCIHGLSAFTATRGFAQEALSPLPPSSPRLVRSWAQVGSGVRPCGPGVLGREEGAGTTIGLSSSVSKYPESVDGSRVRKDIHTSSHRARGAIHGGSRGAPVTSTAPVMGRATPPWPPCDVSLSTAEEFFSSYPCERCFTRHSCSSNEEKQATKSGRRCDSSYHLVPTGRGRTNMASPSDVFYRFHAPQKI